MNDEERLFIGVFPGGLSYADRSRDYARLAFLDYSSLELTLEPDCPPDLAAEILVSAKRVQGQWGNPYVVSSCQQTVMLGSALKPAQSPRVTFSLQSRGVDYDPMKVIGRAVRKRQPQVALAMAADPSFALTAEQLDKLIEQAVIQVGDVELLNALFARRAEQGDVSQEVLARALRAAALQDPSVAQCLVDHGADLFLRSGQYLLARAAIFDNTDLVRYLHECGVKASPKLDADLLQKIEEMTVTASMTPG